MFKNLFLTAILAVFVFSVAHAQDDSLYYDLGRVLVKKSATQTVSISGKDLEKYQVSDLSDAINVWLYGTYTKTASIIYVIDGNIISDVNAYSIFDIEEVTLVQNAVAQSSGAAAGQQMVLIKTRTSRAGKKGIEVNGQSSLVDLNNKNIPAGYTASNQVYDQYYLAAYRNYKNANIGLTADYQRDVDPSSNGNGLEFLEPAHFNRLKINAYANVKLGKHSILIFGANYVPQTNNLSYSKDTTDDGAPPSPENILYKSHVSQHMASANINLKTDIAKGLTNRFSVAYNHYNYFESDNLHDVIDTFTDITMPKLVDRSHNLLVRDYFSYHGKLTDSINLDWTLNTTYRNFEDSTSYYVTFVYSTPNTPVYGSTEQRGYSHTGYKNFMLTPNFDLYYKEVFNAQGGFVALLDNGKATPGTGPAGHFFPFFTTSFNPLKLIGITFIKWQLYASYARQSPLLADDYSSLVSFTLLTPPGTIPYNLANFNQNQQYNNYQTGTSIGLTRNFSITYSYEYKYYQYYAEALGNPDFNGGIQYIPYNGRSVTSRFSLLYNLHAHNFTWNAALNGAETHLQVVDNPALAATENSAYLSAGHRWSGGYTNRFEFSNFFAGLDFLYQDGARPDDLINGLQTAHQFYRALG